MPQDATAVFLGRLDERLIALGDKVDALTLSFATHTAKHQNGNGEMRKLLTIGIAIGSVLTGSGAAAVIKILGA